MTSHFGFSSTRQLMSAFAGWVLLGAATTVGCAFPDHRFTDEQCFNGVDDDGNGLVDCADPGCNPVAKCVAAPDATNGWNGPIAIWQGPDATLAPSCGDSAYSHTAFENLSSNPIAGEMTCPKCECSATSLPGTPECVARLQLSSSDQCGGPRTLMLDTNGETGFLVGQSCTTVTIDSTQFTPQSLFFTEPYAVDTSCSHQQVGTTTKAPLTFGTSLKACDIVQDQMPGGCSSQNVCAPKPGGDFMPLVCIYKEGASEACSGPYYTQQFVFNEYSDGRYCTPCACQPSNVACQISASAPGAYYGDELCTGSYSDIQINSCVQMPQGNPSMLYVKLSYASPVTNGSTGSCQAIGGAIEGDITPLRSYTFCCTPFN